MRFTPSQQQAIDAGNPRLLVSAAAGSGKTAVLVERIVRMIAQEGLSIDRMLIVTFTRAAAGEMRERLENRLAALAQNDARLQRQADLVASAQISTIHSFCQKTVRRHFQHCGIDPQFGLCDERMRTAFYNESMQEVLDALYTLARTDADAASLCKKYAERDIAAMISSLYAFIMSRPDPFDWLSRHACKQWSLDMLDEEPMARAFCAEAQLIAEGMLTLWHEAADMAREAAFPAKYAAVVAEDGVLLRELSDACASGMTALMQRAASVKWMRMPVVKPETGDEAALCEAFKALRSRWKDMTEELKKLLPASAEQAVADLAAMAPATRGLQKAVMMFHEAFSAKKRDQAVIDFGDLEHMTLSVLTEPALRAQLQNQFDAIFVDEYQDVSQLQEAILNGLLRDGGAKQYAFYVGDVKQSIYRFRLAEPGLFLGKLSRYSAEADAPERKIVLNRNFRSKSTVLHSVNRVFAHVMDSRVTEIDYDEDAMLYPGTPSAGDPQTELHILNSDGLRPQDQVMAEAEYIARDILATVGGPIVDGEGNECGRLHFRDIAILVPVAKGVADKVEQALTKAGIPVYCEGAGDAMGSEEVQQLIQYLRLMDNLMNDVALLSVLRSPLFEMNERELADIRLVRPQREASFLTAMLAAAEEAAEPLRSRCRHVTDTLQEERFLLRSMPLGDYLWDFLTRSGLYAHYGAQPGGRLRQANLRMLCHRAAAWEQNHTDGLHGFVESLLLDAGSPESSPTVINPWEDVVRIMTIHKSKGLEFPTVYVMNLGRSMFGRGATRAVSVHGDVGFGLGYVNEAARTRRSTLMQAAIALREKNAERAERARVLYVALTRPKSRLVMVGSDGSKACNPDTIGQTGRDVYAVRQAGSMLDWIMQCVTPQDDVEVFSTEGIRKITLSTNLSTVSTSFPHQNTHWRVVFHTDPSKRNQIDARKDMPEINIPIPQNVENIASGVYEDPLAPKLTFTHLPFKVGVTALCRAMEQGAAAVEDEEETADTKRMPMAVARPRLLSSLPAMPAFLAPPAEERALQTGVQTHRLLGLMDLATVRLAPNAFMAVQLEQKRLVDAGVITPEEAAYIDRGMIAAFLESELGRRMLASPSVMREWSFNLRVSEPFPTTVQGVIDLCFLEEGAWVLVDFKTDRVANAGDLWPRYANQMRFYQQALTVGTPYPVKGCCLYSLRLGQAAWKENETT